MKNKERRQECRSCSRFWFARYASQRWRAFALVSEDFSVSDDLRRFCGRFRRGFDQLGQLFKPAVKPCVAHVVASFRVMPHLPYLAYLLCEKQMLLALFLLCGRALTKSA